MREQQKVARMWLVSTFGLAAAIRFLTDLHVHAGTLPNASTYGTVAFCQGSTLSGSKSSMIFCMRLPKGVAQGCNTWRAKWAADSAEVILILSQSDLVQPSSRGGLHEAAPCEVS